mmetsp:Transcript_14926/g.27576  ORF Transcript_14926/g.27576 Transcript_14926/m.27576 type:complete len:150 (+) Transcript_14926:1179-1628(+)
MLQLVRGLRSFSEKLKFKLHPHSLYVTQAGGEEHPFTGIYHNEKRVGHYNCIVCARQLFTSNQKFFPPTGYAAFWNSVDALIVHPIESSDPTCKGNIHCSVCKAHIGYLYDNGLPPDHHHYQVKSAAIKFVARKEFSLPPPKKKRVKSS